MPIVHSKAIFGFANFVGYSHQLQNPRGNNKNKRYAFIKCLKKHVKKFNSLLHLSHGQNAKQSVRHRTHIKSEWRH